MSKKIKFLIIFIVTLALSLIIGVSVTATKETSNKIKGSSMKLELNSELVQKVYSKLDLLDYSVFYDDSYKYVYFNGPNKEKRFAPDEKMYISLESLYKSNSVIKENLEDDLELLKIKKELIKETISKIFKEELNDFEEVNYRTSSNCGIIDYLMTDEEIELYYRKCDRSKEISKSKLITATKDGDFINIVVKSFYATADEKDKNIYSIKNYNNQDILEKVSLEKLNEETESIFENFDINEYTFSFELKDDEYYLFKVIEKQN